MNALRAKLENNEKILGTLVSLTDPCLCEIMGNIGYDCVWVDMEHTYIGCKDLLCHLNAARSSDIPVVVRVPQNELTVTKKVLEMGPDGIIFPMTRSVGEIRDCIESTLYPPHGTRGFGPLRAIGYGAEDAKEYTAKKSFEMCRFVQIEHINIIDEIEEVAKIPYIDGFIFGPNDLSGSLGEFLNVFGDKTVDAMKKATDILKKHNKKVGLAGSSNENDIKFWSTLGLDMLFAGADWSFVYTEGKRTLENLKKYCQGEN